MWLEYLVRLGIGLYGYCTDFVINLANIVGLSYYEVNALFFIFLWPVVTLLLIAINIVQSLRIKLNKASAKS